MSELRIRPAQAADLGGVVSVFLACWRTAYRGMLPDEVIERWDDPSARAHWNDSLRGVGDGVVVAESDGGVVGVARFGPDLDEPSVGYLASLYVHPRGTGRGTGGRLLEHVESTLADRGFREARLWVFADNVRAIDFYRRHGWQLDGRSRVEPRYGVTEVGMRRAIGAGRDMRTEMAEQPDVLEALIERRGDMLAAVRAVVAFEPRAVILVARGSSENAAVYARYILELSVRRPISLAAPSLWTRYGLREDLAGCVAIAASQSGHTPEIVTTLEALRVAGAATIAITNDAESPLAEPAEVTLDLGVGAEQAVPATKTFSAQLAAFAFIAEALGEPPWTPDDWRALPAAQRGVLADTGPPVEAAEVLAATAASVHLGRGPLLAIALESALKLTETSSLPATGFSSADFLHGPLAVAGGETAAVAYIANGPVAADVRHAANVARAAGSPLILVGDEAGGALAIPVPPGAPEALTPLVHAVRAQQVAAETTLVLGADPDRPRGLSKVTLTA